ncbi:MAG: hypothetical protein U9N10_04490, partial [Bacillota bacterium]|nr:hypothetical protein [Bacillota bacterium]
RNGEYTDLGVRIKNYSSNDEIIDLILYSNGEMDQIKTISIKNRETQLFVFNEIKVLEFGKVEIDIDDDIKFNNERFFSVKENKKKKVLLISDDNIFLQKALINNQNIELYKSNKEIEKLEGYDLYVIDSSDKVFNVDNGAVLSFNSAVLNLFKFNKFDLTGQLIMNDKELFQYLKGKFYIEKSNSFIDSDNHKKCGLFDSEAIVIKGISNNIKYIALGFDIYDTDFPITPDFPVFIDHSLNYLLEDMDYDSFNVLINDKINSSEKYEVTTPSGSKMKGECQIFERGIFLLKDSGSINYISANIDISEFNQSEKKIDSGVIQEVSSINIKKDISKWFLLLALCLLIIEWVVYKYEK